MACGSDTLAGAMERTQTDADDRPMYCTLGRFANQRTVALSEKKMCTGSIVQANHNPV